jgi:hypothetical protein
MKPPEASKVIMAPQRAVWDALTDVVALGDALSQVAELRKLTDGPFDAGTRWRESRKTFGRTVTRTVEVSSVHEPVAYTVRCDRNGLSYRGTVDLVARSENSTQVTMRFDPRPAAATGAHRLRSVLLRGVVGILLARQIRSAHDELARFGQRPG